MALPNLPKLNYQQVLEKKFPKSEWCDWEISDPNDYDTLVWNEEVSASEKPSKEELDRLISKLEGAYSNVFREKRKEEYPPLSEFADAYYWLQEGDDTKMNAYIEKCKEVKNKWPKPKNQLPS